MANQYKNKIIYGDQTLMDITDTTATENDVLEGEVFYSASGARSVGLLGDATQSAHGLMSAADKTKLDGFLSASNYLTSHQDISGKANSADLATVATTGSYADLLNKPDLSQYLTSVPVMTGATSSADGTAGLIPAPTSADSEKFFRGDGTWQDGGRPMVILSYGNSTWAEFEAAYSNNVIVYCRASSNNNPASGSQTRMAFMAYVNNATTPTEVEFQYYRSVSSHSATQMGDQVFVYKLTKTGGWSVTTREASIKSIAAASGSKIGVSWNNNAVTLSNTMTAADMPMSSSDATTVDSAISALSNIITPSIVDVTNKAYTSGSINDLPCGVYRIYNVVTDIPISTSAGYCTCYVREDATKMQIYISDTNRTFTRTKTSNTWTEWIEYAVKSDITTLSDQIMNPEAINPTVPSGITMMYNGCYKMGKIAVISARLSRSGGFAAGSSLLTGLPTPINYSSLQSGMSMMSVSNNRNASITMYSDSGNHGVVYLADTVTDENICINFTYILN